jgi:hypothetical protein
MHQCPRKRLLERVIFCSLKCHDGIAANKFVMLPQKLTESGALAGRYLLLKLYLARKSPLSDKSLVSARFSPNP